MGCTCRPLVLSASPPHIPPSPGPRNALFSALPPPPRLAPLLTSKAPAFSPFKRFTPWSTTRGTFALHSIDPQFGTDVGNGGPGFGGGSTGGGSNDFWGLWWHGGGGPTPRIDPFLLLFFCARAYHKQASQISKWGLLAAATVLSHFWCVQLPAVALERTASSQGDDDEDGAVWEVRGGKWTKLVPNNDSYVVAEGRNYGFGREESVSFGDFVLPEWWIQGRDLFMRLLLPEGFPQSVTSDYLDYSLWRGVQGIASQISGVLATQALLYAVGLGKGAIPTAAAVNWVLKDGIGYISKIFLSKFGRHFDVHPKGWRLFADLLENAAFGMEMLTSAFPHLFVFIGAAAGAGRSAAGLIQGATRSCFYAGFAAQRNYAEVIAKGEAQGMVSRSIGIVLGIGLANCVGTSTSLALASFAVITWVHMFCNLKSYQSVQLRTLNPYRGSLVFSEYLLSGQAPSVKEVNDEEPLFPAVPFLNGISAKNTIGALSFGAKDAAAEIESRLQLGAKLSDVVKNKEDALALFDLFRNEGYILTEHQGKFYVVLKENSSPQDMLKSLFHVNYLYWLERNAGILATRPATDCRDGGRLRMSLEYVQREFKHAKGDAESVGWITDGLIARPLPNRIHLPSLVAV